VSFQAFYGEHSARLETLLAHPDLDDPVWRAAVDNAADHLLVGRQVFYPGESPSQRMDAARSVWLRASGQMLRASELATAALQDDSETLVGAALLSVGVDVRCSTNWETPCRSKAEAAHEDATSRGA
jgi:hypothetical protein